MNTKLKENIHHLVDTCEDELILEEAFNLLNASSNSSEDWWNLLDAKQQQLTLESIEQSVNGKVVAHSIVSERIWQKINP